MGTAVAAGVGVGANVAVGSGVDVGVNVAESGGATVSVANAVGAGVAVDVNATGPAEFSFSGAARQAASKSTAKSKTNWRFMKGNRSRASRSSTF